MISIFLVFFFKQKTAYEMRISDWSSDVCSSDLLERQYGQLDKAVALSDEYVNAFADQKQVLVDFLRQLSFLDSTLGPDIENVRGGFDLLRRLFKDRTSVVPGKSVSVRVDLGGRRIITTKIHNIKKKIMTT